MRRLTTILAGLCVLAAVMIPGFPAAYAQQAAAPRYAQHGPYAVGTRDFVVPDAQRPLDATVWYPALNPDNRPEAITYAWHDLTIDGHVLADAAPDPDGGPYPLVIFSHGLGGLRLQSVYFTEHLASYGFVVIAIDHPGTTLQDGSGVRNLDGIVDGYTNRPEDVLRTIDYAAALTTSDGLLPDMIDTSRVVITGHSFGGYTTIATGGARLDFQEFNAWCRDPVETVFDPGTTPQFSTEPAPASATSTSCFLRVVGNQIAQARGLNPVPSGLWPATTSPAIKAVVALAPWNAPIFGQDGLAALTVPAMIQVGSGDTTTIPGRDAYRFYTEIGSAEKALVVLQGAEHLVFANNMPGVDDPVWDLDQAHALVNHFATAFLLATLNGDPDAAAALAPGAVDFTGIEYTAALGGG